MKKHRGGSVAGSVVATVVLALAVSSASVDPAGAAESTCWRAVVEDWADGGIDRRHALHCYRSALQKLPNDIRTYTTAEDDVRRALLDAIRSVRRGGGAATAGNDRRTPPAARTEPASTEPVRSLQGRQPRTAREIATSAPAAATSPPARAIAAAAVALVLVVAAGIAKYYVRRRARHASP